MSNYEFLTIEEQLLMVLESLASAEQTLFAQNLNPTVNARLITDTEAVLSDLRAKRDELCAEVETSGVDPQLVVKQIMRQSKVIGNMPTAVELAEKETQDAQRDDAVTVRIDAAKRRLKSGDS